MMQTLLTRWQLTTAKIRIQSTRGAVLPLLL